MDLVISKEPDVQAIQRLLRAILRGFKIAGETGVEATVVSAALIDKGLSSARAWTLIDSLIEQGMLARTGSQLYAVSQLGHEFLDALEDAYASGELPEAPKIIRH